MILFDDRTTSEDVGNAGGCTWTTSPDSTAIYGTTKHALYNVDPAGQKPNTINPDLVK